MNIHLVDSSRLQYGGRCPRCSSLHSIPSSPLAIQHAKNIIHHLDTIKRIDFDVEEALSLPELSTDYFWTKGPGRMLGVMICAPSSADPDAIDESSYVVLKAFSGQMSRHWRVPGWVGPVCEVNHELKVYSDYREITDCLTSKINKWNSLIAAQDDGTEPLDAAKERDRLRAHRRKLSHELMGMIQSSYITNDARGRQLSLLEAYYYEHEDAHREAISMDTIQKGRKQSGALKARVAKKREGFPAGTGDCCAPKLIHACHQMGLSPHSVVEFWYGSPPNTATRQGRKDPESSERVHLNVYPPCEKCQTILGSMLCSNPSSL